MHPNSPTPSRLFAKKLKYGVFNALTRSMRKAVFLEPRTVSLQFGHISYLDNVRRMGEQSETIVLVHGLGSDKDTWLPLVKALASRYRIIALDLAGHGESIQDPALDYSVPMQAARLREFLQHMALPKVHLVGSSMGGAIASCLAGTCSDHLRSLILIDSFGAIQTPSSVMEFYLTHGYNPIIRINNKEDYRNMLKLVVAKPPRIPGFLLDVLTDRMRNRLGINSKIFDDIKTVDLSQLLPGISVPTLILWGKEDEVLHADDATLFQQKIPNSQLHIFDETGHVPMVEAPQATAARIVAFLDSLPA